MRVPTQSFLAKLFVLIAMIGFNTPSWAHDPAKHGFSLVLFDKSFPAPDFQLDLLGDEQTTLSAYQGQYVLLNFWATWCPPCLEEMPSMERLYQEFRDRKFVVVAVSSDEKGAATVQPFIDKLKTTFPIMLDTKGDVAKVYGARQLPVTFLLDPKGNVIAAAQGERDWSSKESISVFDELLPKQ
ncbi:MAG: TlpA disulfide reductase family protein [Pseudomonadota bacterium]